METFAAGCSSGSDFLEGQADAGRGTTSAHIQPTRTASSVKSTESALGKDDGEPIQSAQQFTTQCSRASSVPAWHVRGINESAEGTGVAEQGSAGRLFAEEEPNSLSLATLRRLSSSGCFPRRWRLRRSLVSGRSSSSRRGAGTSSRLHGCHTTAIPHSATSPWDCASRRALTTVRLHGGAERELFAGLPERLLPGRPLGHGPAQHKEPHPDRTPSDKALWASSRRLG